MESLAVCRCIPGVEVAYICRAEAADDCGGGGVGMIGSRVSRFPVGSGGDLYLQTYKPDASSYMTYCCGDIDPNVVAESVNGELLFVDCVEEGGKNGPPVKLK